MDHYAQGATLYRQGQYAQAVVELSKAGAGGELVGQLGRYYEGMSHRALGLDALREGQFGEAEQRFRQAMACLGTQAELTSFLASSLAQQGQHDLCVQEMEKLARRPDATVGVWRRLAQAQWRSGRADEAFMTIQEAMRRLGPVPALHLQIGMFYAAQEKMAPAREHLTRAAEADASNADAHYYLGLVASACQDLRLATRSLQRAFSLRPGDVLLAYQLSLAARAASERGFHLVVHLPDRTAAVPAASQSQQLAQYVAGETDFIEAFLALPPSDVDEELFEMLHGVMQVALAQHGDYADLHLNCSRVLGRLGRVEEALQAGLRATQINPRYVKALVHVAQLHVQLGQQSAAMVRLREAIAAGADYPDVHCLAGEVMRDLQRPEDAKRHLLRALELNANFKRAASAMETLAA